jgi:phosphatidylserine/phosphatidylglycerophosphate/cardiolipin synthase-like enzyme
MKTLRFPSEFAASLALVLVTLVLPSIVSPSTASAQSRSDRPPEGGGEVFQLGMPPVWKGHAGGTIGWYTPGDSTGQAQVLGHAGILKDLMSPVAGVAAIGVEGYGGFRGVDGLDGGGRALFSIPALHFTTGADYNIADNRWSWLLRLEIPFRRTGIFGRGSQVRFDYLPGFDNTFAVGVNVPLWSRNSGETRPQRDAVELDTPPIQLTDLATRPAGLDETIGFVRDGAMWITELSMPLTDTGGDKPEEKYAGQIARIQDRLSTADVRFPNGRSLNEEIEAYHDEIDRAFSLAAGGAGATESGSTEQGRAISAAARRILLERVLIPYDQLLGQRKSHDGLDQYLSDAHSEFGRWILQDSGITMDRYEQVYWTFQELGQIAEEVREFQKERWDDSRLVWLPLQLALRAEDHDTGDEMRALIELGTKQTFKRGNRTQYVLNEEFQLEFFRSVHEARDYHVLWIHDYRGNNGQGKPDEVAFKQTVRGYIRAMTERIEEYDETHVLPQYFIFLDQNYFEANNSRLFFRVLLDPMNYELNLPDGYEEWELELQEAQERLRQAVANSILLQTEASQFGEKWLEKRIRVHINITNPSDFSFTSLHVAGIMPVPDNLMRDHRKIAFYDITEEDPYRGLAMFTGMGIGEHYVGPHWEDRAVIIRGPGALRVKTAARELLEQQGFKPDEIPFPLRPLDKPADYEARVDSVSHALEELISKNAGYTLQLHNKTGFADKPINVEKAILYSLMPSGSLLKIPDSLWQNYVYASMLTGSALRGCKVLIMLPSLRSAPSSASVTMARAHGLFSGVLVLKNGLEEQIEAEGGLLKVGLYAPRVGVGDLAGRIEQARTLTDPWLREIYVPNPALRSAVDSAMADLESANFSVDYLVASDTDESPKLHMKANYFITGEVWYTLMALPEWGPVFYEYLQYLALQTGPPEARPVGRDMPEELIASVADLAYALEARLTPEQAKANMAFFTVGSTNMDYRSMVMDGEVQITLGGWNSLAGLVDFLFIAGLCEWVDTQEELDALLPPPSGMTRSMANFMKLAL